MFHSSKGVNEPYTVSGVPLACVHQILSFFTPDLCIKFICFHGYLSLLGNPVV